MLHSATDLMELRREIIAARKPRCVTVCSETGCQAVGAAGLADALEAEVIAQGLDDQVEVRRTGCHGLCEQGPVVVILPERTAYLRVRTRDAGEIVASTLAAARPVERLLYRDPDSGERIVQLDDIPFYRHQQRIIHANNALVDAARIEDYLAIGGYAALARALTEMTPDQVLQTISESELRGRGGGGFPAGTKWQTTRDAPGQPKYVIVNADEGDPGAFMDRSLLEGNPHGVLEGLALGAYAIGSCEGYVYVREEYPVATHNIQVAIDQAQRQGLLGSRILGSEFNFSVTVHRGAGAFVSGESSALVSAIEGRVGEPRPKYIHTSQCGLWDKPSCLNNVETWANVPFIINRGASWFRGIGTSGSKGTKIFSLVGKVVNTGLVEVPMGTTLRQIVYDIGGGVADGRPLKAVQTGGPSGGVLPASLLDTPVDFDALSAAGSMMGSGGLIVMDEATCMVDTARYYTEFLARESCGKCVPCREGLRQMLRILNRITAGEAEEGDVELLEDLGEVLQEASLCALGKSAPNPVLSTIAHFRDEYEAHITDRYCPAGVCRRLIVYYISPKTCTGCGACVDNCPVDAIRRTGDDTCVIDQQKCTQCGSCVTACPDKSQAAMRISRQFYNVTGNQRMCF
jgi:NADP-reducing hydrogenase subunit HndC